MNMKLFACVAAVVVLAGCGNNQPASSPTSAETAAKAPAPTVAAAVPRGDSVPLMNGYVAAFPHKLRSRKQADTPEGSRNVVVLEYLGMDRGSAIRTLSQSLSGKGYRVHGPLPRQAGVQYAFFGPDGHRMDAIFSDENSRALVNRDARGVVMFSWTQPTGQ